MPDIAPGGLRVAMMIETDGPGGAEVVLIHLAEELRRRGHHVTAVGPAHGEGWLSGRLRALGFERRSFALRGPLDPVSVAEFVRMLRELRADVVHSHEFTMAVYGCAAARWLGIPHVVTMHGNESVIDAWRRRLALRWVARTSRAFVAVSEHTRNAMQARLRLPETLVGVIPNGVPLRSGDREATRRKLGIDDESVLILSVGNLRRRKGHSVLLEALGLLHQDGCAAPWQLAIAGAGVEMAHLTKRASDFGVADRVQLLGHRDDVPDLLAAADVLAMPSFWEGMPVAVLEGMGAGKAVVASAVGGIPEVIRHGETGLLVPVGDASALAGALRELLEDPALRERLAASARQRALSEFDVRVMADRYEQLYRAADARPAPA